MICVWFDFDTIWHDNKSIVVYDNDVGGEDELEVAVVEVLAVAYTLVMNFTIIADWWDAVNVVKSSI